MIRPKRLSYKDQSGAGKHIYADIDKELFMGEFTKLPGRHTILKANLMGYEPWMQFPAEEWDEMLETLFIEMVIAWNEKHSKE